MEAEVSCGSFWQFSLKDTKKALCLFFSLTLPPVLLLTQMQPSWARRREATPRNDKVGSSGSWALRTLQSSHDSPDSLTGPSHETEIISHLCKSLFGRFFCYLQSKLILSNTKNKIWFYSLSHTLLKIFLNFLPYSFCLPYDLSHM